MLRRLLGVTAAQVCPRLPSLAGHVPAVSVFAGLNLQSVVSAARHMRLSLLPEHVIAFVAFAVRATERNIDFGGSKGILLLRCVVTPLPPQILVATREASGAAVFLHFLGSAVTEHGLVLRRIGEQGYRRRPERPRPSSGWGCPRHEGSDRKHGSDFF